MRRGGFASTSPPRRACAPRELIARSSTPNETGGTLAYCPECGAHYEPAVVACPRCRAILTADPPATPGLPEVVHRVPDAAAGALLCGVLEHNGIEAVLRSATLPGYGTVRRDWSTSAWGEILVAREDASEARALIADYLLALERGGQVRDEDVEGIEPGS